MTGLGRISIIIPTRDRPDWLPRTLASAMGQQNVEAELVVVDDGSRRPVEGRLTRDARSRIRVVRNEEPRGVSAARNAGIAAADGEWLAFLDDDDVWAPSKLERTLRAAVATDAQFAYSGGLEIGLDGIPRRIDSPEPENLRRALLARNAVPVPSSNLMVSADLARALNGFDERLAHMADWDLLLRLSGTAHAASASEPLVAYTLHGSNMQQDDAELEAELEHFERKHASARKATGVSLDRTAWINWRIRARRLAGDRRGAAASCLRLAWQSRDPAMVARGIVIAVGGERAAGAARAMRDRVGRGAGGRSSPPWLTDAMAPAESVLRGIWDFD
jgi:glycosyltransferase involved in cell wall biosynthesis